MIWLPAQTVSGPYSAHPGQWHGCPDFPAATASGHG